MFEFFGDQFLGVGVLSIVWCCEVRAKAWHRGCVCVPLCVCVCVFVIILFLFLFIYFGGGLVGVGRDLCVSGRAAGLRVCLIPPLLRRRCSR